jgi:hypothetical protein
VGGFCRYVLKALGTERDESGSGSFPAVWFDVSNVESSCPLTVYVVTGLIS